MDTTRNTVLEAWMTEHGYSSNSLAEAVNRAIERLTGRPGGLDGSSVRAWKAGRVTTLLLNSSAGELVAEAFESAGARLA
ncbi:hypothetical protein [Streptomyces sp. NPDC001758]